MCALVAMEAAAKAVVVTEAVVVTTAMVVAKAAKATTGAGQALA